MRSPHIILFIVAISVVFLFSMDQPNLADALSCPTPPGNWQLEQGHESQFLTCFYNLYDEDGNNIRKEDSHLYWYESHTLTTAEENACSLAGQTVYAEGYGTRIYGTTRALHGNYYYPEFEVVARDLVKQGEAEGYGARCDSLSSDQEQESEIPSSQQDNGCPINSPYLWSDGLCHTGLESDYLPNGCPVGYQYIWSDGQCYDQSECTADYPYRLSSGMCSNQPACQEGYVYVESLDACALTVSEAEKRIKEYEEKIKTERADSVKSELSLGNLGKIISKTGNVQITKIDDNSIVNSNGITEASILKTGNEANTNIKIQSDNGGTINLGPDTFFGHMLVGLKDIDPKDIPEERRKALASFLGGMYWYEVSKRGEKELDEIFQKSHQEDIWKMEQRIQESIWLQKYPQDIQVDTVDKSYKEKFPSVHYILKDGLFHRDVSEQEKKKQESVITPHAIITSKNTDYEVIVTDDTTRLNVLHGVVEVIALDENGETMVVNTGESLIISTTQFKKTKFDINSMNKWWEELAEEAMAQEETMMEKEMTESESMEKEGGGCLIATATFGSELAPQVQQLRELRDNSLLQTASGTSFMNSFNQFYYSFSPTIADRERENPVFKEAVKIAITPMISSLSILNYVDMDSEVEVLVYGISLILLNGLMYVGIPIAGIIVIRKRF